MLLGVFIYWGWDSGVAVNEESEDPAEGPGKAAVVSTVMLVLIYLLVVGGRRSRSMAPGFLSNEENASDVLNALGNGVLGGTLNKLLIIAVLTSASASTQTTILPTARTTLSMAHWKAVTSLLSRDPQTLSDADSLNARASALLSIVVTVALLLLSSSIRARTRDRRARLPNRLLLRLDRVRVRRSLPARTLQERCATSCCSALGPVLGGLILWGWAARAIFYYGHKANVEAKPILGITLPLWFGDRRDDPRRGS